MNIQHFIGLNCFEENAMNYLEFKGYNSKVISLKLLRFTFTYNVQTVSEGISFIYSVTSLLHDIFNLQIERTRYNSLDELINLVKNTHVVGGALNINIDSYNCPWHHLYKKEHKDHYILILEYDSEKNSFLCIDSAISKEIQNIRTDCLPKDSNKCSILFIDNLKQREFKNIYKDILLESAHELANTESQYEYLINFIKYKIDFLKEFNYMKDLESPLERMQLEEILYRIAGIHLLCSDFLKCFSNSCEIAGKLSDSMHTTAQKWQTLRCVIVKQYYKKEFNLKASVVSLLEQILFDELRINELFCDLSCIKSSDLCYEDIKIVEKEEAKFPINLDLENIKLEPFLNNKAFYNKQNSSNPEGVDGNGVFYVYNKKEIEKLNNSMFLLDNLSKASLDNISCRKQQIDLKNINGVSDIFVLGSAIGGCYTGELQLYFEDESFEKHKIVYANTVDFNSVYSDSNFMKFDLIQTNSGLKKISRKGNLRIFHIKVKNSLKRLTTIVLPDVEYIHIFAITLGKNKGDMPN